MIVRTGNLLKQITPANIFYIVLHIQDVAVYISLKNDGRQLWNYDLRSRQDMVLA